MAGDVCQLHEMTLEMIKQFQDNQKEIVSGLSETKERVALTEASTKSAHHRLDAMEKQTEAIIRMSVSVETMAQKMQEMINYFKDHDGRLDKLEQAPAQAVFAYWKLFVGALITGGAGIVLGIVIKGVI